jgi:Skp family chaperone for outer membrane proteins
MILIILLLISVKEDKKMGISDRYQIYAEKDAKDIHEAYKTFAKANAMLNGINDSNLKINEEIKAKCEECIDILKDMQDKKKEKKDIYKVFKEHKDAYEEFQEDKQMEKKEEKKQITSKQAIKAIGRNFGRWVKKHKWEIAGCAVSAVILGSIWHKSAAIVDQDTNTTELTTQSVSWGGNEHYICDEGYFNWKKEPNNTWSTFFCLEPTISSINIDPAEFDEIMELIKKDYHDDYKAMWDALAEN